MAGISVQLEDLYEHSMSDARQAGVGDKLTLV